MLFLGVDLAWGIARALGPVNETGLAALSGGGDVVAAAGVRGVPGTVEWSAMKRSAPGTSASPADCARQPGGPSAPPPATTRCSRCPGSLTRIHGWTSGRIVDALLCAWTASLWSRHGFGRCQVLGEHPAGDPVGTIIAPARPEHRRDDVALSGSAVPDDGSPVSRVGP